MKILQINASYRPAYIYGGPTMSVSRLSEQLVKAGIFVHVYTTTANGAIELPVLKNQPVNIDGVMVTYFKRLTKDHSHFSPRLALKLWKNAKSYDVIHIHAWWNLVSVFSALIAHLRKVPVLVSPRGTLSNYSFNNKKSLIKKKLHNWLGNNLLNRSYIHATSGAEYKTLNNIIDPIKIFNLPNFVKFPAPLSVDPLTDKMVFKLLFLSRIEEKKGLDILLEALPQIKYPYHLTIAGDGNKNYIDQLKNSLAGNPAAGNISWIGFQDEYKFELLSDHHLFVLPSYDENFGNVVIESLAMGTAVLISEYVGLADYVKKNNLGWLCNTDANSVSSNINDIIANKQGELALIRKNASFTISKDFNEDELVKKYIAMYNQIIDHE